MSRLRKFAFVLVMLGAGHASATGLPQVDTSKLTKQIMENIQEAGYNETLLQIIKQNIASAFDLGGLGIEADNNAMANNIARRGKAMQDIQNLKTLEQSAPDPDACATLAASHLKSVAEVGEERLAENRARARNYYRARAAESAFSPAPDSRERHADKVAILDREAERSAETSAVSVGPSVLFGSRPSASGDIRQAAADFIDAIAPVFVPSGTDALGMDSQKQRFVEGRLRYGAMQNTPEASLGTLLGQASSPGGGAPSTLFVLSKEAEGIYLSPDSFANKVGRGDLSISQMMRRAAAAKALQLHMDMLAYRQALRQEVLLAVKLAQKLP